MSPDLEEPPGADACYHFLVRENPLDSTRQAGPSRARIVGSDGRAALISIIYTEACGMKIYHEELSDVGRYIATVNHKKLEVSEWQFKDLLRRIKKFKDINHETRILEVGTGTGWFPILCKKEGLSCKGLEISPQLVEYARCFGEKYGVEPDIELGNIEEAEIGTSQYDIVVAMSSFEHVEHWQRGLRKIFSALKPGGLLYFYSTNKFSFRSGEYNFPLYGWMPNSWRYRLRKTRQGEDIMKLGIDFNQFTYWQLRRFFKDLGFSQILDRVEALDPDNLNNPRFYKKVALKILKGFPPLKHLILLFSGGTFFICIK